MSRRGTNRTGNSSTAIELPEYEPPACPLTDAARRKLHDLSHSRSTAAYQQQINESIRLLGFSVSDIHERLRVQREELARLKLRREERGTEKSEDEQRLEAHLPELEERINTLTAASEQAIRDMIDHRAELEDEDVMFGELYDKASAEAAQQREVDAQRGEQDDEQEPLAATSILELYKELRQKKDSEYTKMSAHQRYALNNDYAGFKKLWHDAMAGDEGPPLPDASRWFTSDGEPIMTGDVKGAGAGDGDDDDDIAVEREVKSINCPLTLQPMKDPYTNRNCKHTFEKAALLEYLPMRGESQCPQAGCSQKFTRARFDHEFFQDQAMARRIKRVRLAQQQQQMMDDEDEGDGDDELRVKGSQAVPGRPLKRERRGE
ncbi:DNA repair MMS21 [Fusarium subglutinans]|uniref:DNA repair MMS21 n=1 Tax=Gibberella subglutinans TaxID=42677 RepID=A0A8H5LB40_GIBSU|nr:DNA repair MMS21 [Fusarium subglutinans]KAF5589740.1 DNA repair MMS21 [Fusarium subglutinans]